MFLAVILIALTSLETTLAGLKFTIEDTTKTPKSFCSVQDKNPTTSNRPKLPIHGSTLVTDSNEDGKLDWFDIQSAIATASRRYQLANEELWIQRVLLQEQDLPYILYESINLPSWVLLDWNDQRILIHKDYILNDMIRIEKDSNHTWVYNMAFNSNQNIRNRNSINWSGIVNISDNANHVFLYENLFISDKVENRDIIGNNDSIAWVHVWNKVSRVFIDSNHFSHVPTGVNIIWAWASDIRITHNTFSHWRLRSIYTRGNADPINKLIFAHNRINIPKFWTVRQPIAFHTWEDAQPTYDVNIYDNVIQGADVPHIAIRDLEAGTVNTTSTNGTADMISIHNVDNFSIVRNCVINGWEVGITISHGSKNGKIVLNHLEWIDTAGMILWAGVWERVSNIEVRNNYILNAWRNRAQHKANWAYAWIVIASADNTRHWRNTIIETERNYDEEWEAHTLFYGISIWSGSVWTTEQISANIFDISPETIEIWETLNR